MALYEKLYVLQKGGKNFMGMVMSETDANEQNAQYSKNGDDWRWVLHSEAEKEKKKQSA